jgi:hypothetical protein
MKQTILYSILALMLSITGCRKKTANEAPVDPRVPPDMAFKTGSGYTSGDVTVSLQDTLTIGVIVTKTEDNLTSFNASVSYDGSITTTTFFNHHLSSNEYSGYTVDIPYYTRNQPGIEALTFSIVDRDGNITKKTITVTVQ